MASGADSFKWCFNSLRLKCWLTYDLGFNHKVDIIILHNYTGNWQLLIWNEVILLCSSCHFQLCRFIVTSLLITLMVPALWSCFFLICRQYVINKSEVTHIWCIAWLTELVCSITGMGIVLLDYLTNLACSSCTAVVYVSRQGMVECLCNY